MKARDSQTGTFKDVYVKALDSMPVGTQVEYTGSTIPTGWEEVNDYSTTEIDTGKKWIDGKHIYRKKIDFTISSTANTYVNVAHNINNIETKISYEAYYLYYNELYKMPNSEVIAIKFSNSNFSYYSKTSGLSGSSAYAILEYTKTTD